MELPQGHTNITKHGLFCHIGRKQPDHDSYRMADKHKLTIGFFFQTDTNNNLFVTLQ